MEKSKLHVWVACLFTVLIMILGISCAMPGDKEALKKVCASALTVCDYNCRGNSCSSACGGGYNACFENIEQDKPSDWQPADSFYDGCMDVCEYDACANGCFAGQQEAAKQSSGILKKYGTITL